MKTNTKPPYRLVADSIREKVLAGEYALGKLPSERALIRQYGISRATAAKVLATLEREGLVVRRRGAGAFVNPQSATSENAYVSTLIADMDVREFFSAICGSIADRARAYNLNLIWGARQEFNELSRDGSLDDYVARCKAANIKGVFFVPQDAMGERGVELRNQEIAETLRRKGITVVLIDRDIVPFPRRSDFDFVGIDNVQAGYMQAKHLIACGCRRLVYVSHEKQVWTVDARFNGMRNALEECGLPTDGPRRPHGRIVRPRGHAPPPRRPRVHPRRHGDRLHGRLLAALQAPGEEHRPRRHLAQPAPRHFVPAPARPLHRRGGRTPHGAPARTRHVAATPGALLRRTHSASVVAGRLSVPIFRHISTQKAVANPETCIWSGRGNA